MSLSEAKLSPTGQDNNNEGNVGANNKTKQKKRRKDNLEMFSLGGTPCAAETTLEEEEGVQRVSSGWVATAEQGSSL